MNIEKLTRNPSDAPDQPRWTETLRDGSQVVVRPLAQADREAERAFIEELSPEPEPPVSATLSAPRYGPSSRLAAARGATWTARRQPSGAGVRP